MPNEPRLKEGSLSPTGPFEQINSLCASFSGEWKPEAQPAFDGYLAQVARDAQPTLLRNLLHIEIERRRAAGEKPEAQEYILKLPQHASLIRQAFLESSSAFHSASAETPASLPAAVKAPVANRLGEYQLLRELGRGGMGTVYQAVHVRRNNRVALKTLPLADGPKLHLFKREFRSLADINHPNLVGLHTLEMDGGQWFFTMDLLEGENFLAHVRPSGALDEARLRAALAQLVTGVLALHAKHIIHRDLKPSNVMVTNEGRVVVLDFGLVLEEDQSWSTDKIAGTPRYMAPEQAIGEGKVGSACDWYAVGVVLYEALSGSAPFVGPPLHVLQAKQSLDPPLLPHGPEEFADLRALAMNLLARDPDRRPDARAIVKVVATRAETPAIARPVSGSRLVGREQQLAALQDAYRTVRKLRQPLTVLLSGRSGEGKTSLAEHFLEPLRRKKQEVTVMSGRCYDRESVPFKALDSLIDALASYLRALPEIDAALLLPKDIGVLVQVFPVLQRVKVVEKAPRARTAGLDEQQVRQRAFAALRELLWRQSDRTPLVWCIDDLQWGDADSAEALFGVLRPPEAPVVLFLGAYRSDEADASPFLRKWEELKRKHDVQLERRDVTVGPLNVAECTDLVLGLLGQDSEAIRRRAAEFAREAGGNPFLLTALVGCFDPQTDSFHALPMHEVIEQKLGRLPEDAGRLLDVIAVSGQALGIEEASRAAGHDASAISTLTHMRNERLVRLLGTEDEPRVDTYHDRIRETVLGQMDEGPRRAIHRTLAEIVEAEAGGLSAAEMASLEKGEPGEERTISRVYDIAYHFDAAGDKRKAWMYALLAAEQARRQFSLDVAAKQFAIAKRNGDGLSKAILYRIAEGAGDALQLLGRYEEANQQLSGTIDLVEGAEKKARIEVLQGEIAFKQAMIDKSIVHFERGLRRLGNWVPGGLLGLGYGLVRETAIQLWHSLWPGRLNRKPSSSQADLTIRLFNRSNHSYLFQNTFKMLWAHLSGMNRAELLPPSSHLAFSHSLHGCYMAMLGWHSRGKRYGDRSLALARELDDIWGYGHSCTYKGIGLYASARYEEGLASLAEAIDAFEKTADMWELNLAHFHTACCHYGLGNLAGAVTEARWAFESSARLGDTRTLCSSWLWARATRGNVPFEDMKSCFPRRPDDIMSTVHGMLAEGLWHSYHGRTEEALQVCDAAATLVRNTFCVNSHTILTLPMLAMASRLRGDALASKDAKRSEQLHQRAYRLAKWSVRITRLFPAVYPLSLRELALILEARGKTKKAHKYATKSCAVAEKQKAKYEHAQSLLVRGKLAKQLGIPEGEAQVREAEKSLDEIEKPVRALSGLPARNINH